MPHGVMRLATRLWTTKARNAGRGAGPYGFPGIDALFARWVDAGRNVGSLTARTLKLLDLYQADLLAGAMAEVLARGMHDPGALAQVCEQHRRAKSLPNPVAVRFGAHVPDRDVIPHDLESYDAQRRRD